MIRFRAKLRYPLKHLTLTLVGLAALSLSVSESKAAEHGPAGACKAALNSELSGWELSPPPAELAAYAREQSFDTNIARADFDADGSEDLALLVVSKLRRPEADRKTRSSQYIAVCLSKSERSKLILIKEPYCGDGISVSLKDAEFYNYETDRKDKYPTNGIHAYCFEKAGATYLFQNGAFRRVIDSD